MKSKAGLDTGIDKSRVGLKKKTPTDVDDPAKLEAEKKKKPSVPKVTRRSRTPKKKTNTDEKEQKPVKKTPPPSTRAKSRPKTSGNFAANKKSDVPIKNGKGGKVELKKQSVTIVKRDSGETPEVKDIELQGDVAAEVEVQTADFAEIQTEEVVAEVEVKIEEVVTEVQTEEVVAEVQTVEVVAEVVAEVEVNTEEVVAEVEVVTEEVVVEVQTEEVVAEIEVKTEEVVAEVQTEEVVVEVEVKTEEVIEVEVKAEE